MSVRWSLPVLGAIHTECVFVFKNVRHKKVEGKLKVILHPKN